MFSWTAVSGATYTCIFDGGAEFDCKTTIVEMIVISQCIKSVIVTMQVHLATN